MSAVMELQHVILHKFALTPMGVIIVPAYEAIIQMVLANLVKVRFIVFVLKMLITFPVLYSVITFPCIIYENK